jgi:hypothetical protein
MTSRLWATRTWSSCGGRDQVNWSGGVQLAPYWGRNTTAAVIHFHGPKPYERELLRSGTLPTESQWMLPFSGGAYDELADIWHRAFSDATA